MGAYAKYSWPYVWLRSRPRGRSAVDDIDAPLDLPSTKQWKSQGASWAWVWVGVGRRAWGCVGEGWGSEAEREGGRLPALSRCCMQPDRIHTLTRRDNTTRQHVTGLRVWHILEELVEMNAATPPANPFAVDFEALSAMPPLERTLQVRASARECALMWFLGTYVFKAAAGGEGRPP